MALLAAQQPTPAGTVITLVSAAGGGDTYRVVPGTSIRVKNADATSKTVTVVSYKTPASTGLTDAGLVVPVAAGTEKEIRIPDGELDRFINPATGVGSITYSAVTSVTVGVITR